MNIIFIKNRSQTILTYFKKKHESSNLTVIFLLYLFLSIFFTYPLILNLNSSIPGSPGDGYLYLWNIFAFWSEITNLNNPFFTKLIFYPVGANLIFHTAAPLVSFFGAFFLKNLNLYMNLLIILSISFTALTMFFLSRYLTKNLLVSFIAGIIYAFCPTIYSFIISQHFYFLFAASIFPLGVLFSFKYFDSLKVKFLLLIIVIFWVIFFIDYYSAILYGLVILILFLINLTIILNKKNLRPFLKIILISFITPGIIIYLVFFGAVDFSVWIGNKSNYAATCSTNLLGFITPSETNTFLNFIPINYFRNVNYGKNFDTPSYYLGISILILGFISFLKFWKNKKVLSLGTVFISIMLLSLGTVARFGNFQLLLNQSMPFYWLSKLPFLGLIDCPLRFTAVLQLSLAGLAAILLGKIFIKLNKISALIILFFVLLIVSVEFHTEKLELSEIKIPTIYKLLSQYPDKKTVLELPSGLAESKGAFGYDWSIKALHSQQMYWQTTYQKPKVGGYISRIPSSTYNYFRTQPVISDLFTLSSLGGSWSGNDYSKDQIQNFISQFNLGYIILSPNPRRLDFETIIQKVFNDFITEKHKEDGFILYKIKR